jgi:hypothetical protein
LNTKVIAIVLVLATSGIFLPVRAKSFDLGSGSNRVNNQGLIFDLPPDPNAVYPGNRFKHDETYSPQLQVYETNEPWKSWFGAINRELFNRFERCCRLGERG